MSADHRVLVVFDLPDHEPLARPVVEALSTMEVVALGFFNLPEQTPPEIARDQFEADAQAELDEIVDVFAAADIPTDTRLVFGKNRAKAIDRAALDADCDVVLTPGDADAFDRILVPLRGETNLDRILAFVVDLLSGAEATVTLFHASDDTDRLPGEELLAHASEQLIEAGVDPDRIDSRLVEGDAQSQIVSLAADHDLLVLGESEPSMRERIVSTLLSGITAGTDDPSFVVRNPDVDGPTAFE